jgi:hypothetical protein
MLGIWEWHKHLTLAADLDTIIDMIDTCSGGRFLKDLERV